VLYPDAWSQTRAIMNDFMRATFSPGDDPSDPNCPMVCQYYPRTQHGLTTNMAAKTPEFNQALFMEEVQNYECIHRIHKWRPSWGQRAVKRENEAL